MKRQWVIAGMTAVMACIPMTAGAEVNLEEVSQVGDVNWIYDSTLLRASGGNGYYVQTIDGTALTDAVYTNQFENSYGYLTTYKTDSSINGEGVLDQNGTEIVPFQYGDVEVLNREWILGIVLTESTADQYDYKNFWGDEAYYLIQTVDVYHVADGTATCLVTLDREHYMESRAYGSYINIKDRSSGIVSTYDAGYNQVATDIGDTYNAPEGSQELVTFRENGQYGIKDAQGNVIMEPSFYSVYDFRYGYAAVSTGEKEGLVDEDGNVVVEAVYDDVKTSYYMPYDEEADSTSGYNALGYFAVVQDGKLGFVDGSGNVTCEPKYSESVMELNGASALMTDLEGNERIIAADGVETVLEGYDRVSAMNYGSGMYYQISDGQGNYGMIDWHGQVIVPCEADDVDISGDGKYLLVDMDYGDDMKVIYALPEMGAQAPAAEDAPAEGAEQSPQEQEAAEGEKTAGSSEAATLIDSASMILSADTADNRTSAKALLEQAKVSAEGNDAAVSLLGNAITLLDTEGSDMNSILTIISSAKTLL